ncbi:tetratricopeptide repeat protein [Flavitalea antarctica]
MKTLILFFVVGSATLMLTSSQPEKQAAVPNRARNQTYCAPSFDPSKLDAANAPIFKGLGNLHYPITTRSAKAQQYFDQGLTLIYAFNHGEAGRSFKAAIRLDSTSAMPYWGLAMVLGPNYNAALNPTSLEEINDAINKAVKYSASAKPSAKALIAALRQRFPEKEVKDMTPYNEAYSAAMKKAHEQFPDDINIAALYVDAMMNEHPWDLWFRNGTPKPWTPAIVETLEKLLATAPDHVGANHMYIHLMEASPRVADAVPAANRLRNMLPSAGHILHMPSHIDIRTGEYHKGVVVNERASAADSSYIAQCKVQGVYPMMYYPHNIHFLAACAFLEGNSKKAIDAAWSIARHSDKTYIYENPAIQHYSIIPFYVLTQLGKWDDVLTLQQPDTALIYPLAIWHYARGMAFNAKNDAENAAKELQAIREVAKDTRLATQFIWGVNSAAQLTTIATNVLNGEINAKKGLFDEAIASLEQARDIEDSLMYQEPPDWFFSTRHTLGHILLQAKKFEEAEKVYLQDMVTYPENGWALMGLYKSLMGQGKIREAKLVKTRFDKAWKWSDLTISSSRV